jgi:hypothetical protein
VTFISWKGRKQGPSPNYNPNMRVTTSNFKKSIKLEFLIFKVTKQILSQNSKVKNKAPLPNWHTNFLPNPRHNCERQQINLTNGITKINKSLCSPCLKKNKLWWKKLYRKDKTCWNRLYEKSKLLWKRFQKKNTMRKKRKTRCPKNLKISWKKWWMPKQKY